MKKRKLYKKKKILVVCYNIREKYGKLFIMMERIIKSAGI
jgi:hypothetical protein